MKSTPSIRAISITLLLASGLALAAPDAAIHLTLDEELRPEAAQAEQAPIPFSGDEPDLAEAPLNFSRALPPAADSGPVLAPAEVDGTRAASAPAELIPPAASRPLHTVLEAFLRLIWALTASLLCLHLAREWLRVMRVRVRRPERSIALEHAPWPAVSILIPARGDAGAQAARLDALHSCFFDYPVERIHLVPMFDPADTEVIAAVARLTQAFPERVHPLPMMAGRNVTLAAALHAANACSMGTALIVLDQEAPLPQTWLRQSVTPLLDPAVGAVLTRAIPEQTESALSARLALLGDQADTLIATQSDALSLLLCGKARIRALRRQAVKGLDAPDLQHAPDGASIVLALTRMGWQSRLLGEILECRAEDAPDLIRSPRLRLSIAWRSMRMASLLLNPRIPLGARLQGGAAFFSAALPLIWLASLASGLALYFIGAPLTAGLAVALCAATSFDPHGQPSPAFSLAAGARMAGIRTEIRLLPLSSLAFIDRILDGLRTLLRARRERPQPRAAATPAAQEAA